MKKLTLIAVAMSATVLGAFGASAQTTTTTVIERRAPPPVVVEPAPTTTVTTEKNEIGLGGILGSERKTTETTSSIDGDCQHRTTQTNTLLGSSTKTSSTCN